MSKIHNVTGYKETGKALIKKVVEEINDTQAFIITPLPDTIKMRLDQYDTLIDQEELEFMQEYSELLDQVKQSKNMLFKVQDRKQPTGAPLCVMEVQIEGGDYERQD